MVDHVAILVSDLASIVASLEARGWPMGPVEEFPSEGTKEVYVGPPDASARLLLLESIGDGPYREALRKRGPGLHHIAIHVPDVAALSDRLSGSGWYLHPTSVRSYRDSETIWLARPGVAMLVEVTQAARGQDHDDPFVARIEVPLPDDQAMLIADLGLGDEVVRSSDRDAYLTIDGTRRALGEFLR